jgi:hypothetical protein
MRDPDPEVTCGEQPACGEERGSCEPLTLFYGQPAPGAGA